MRTDPYPTPLDRFPTLGEPDVKEWLDYLALGVRPEHVPQLVRMVFDEALYDAGPDKPEGWAYVHAWRALAQLRAVEAVPSLLELFASREDDEAVLEELPDALGRIGPAALPALAAYLADAANGTTQRALAADAVVALAERHSEAQEQSVQIIAGQLERFAEQDRELNAFLVADLVKLNAAGAAPLIQRAYEDRAVSNAIAGPWDSVRQNLGLRPTPPAPQMEETPAEPLPPTRGSAPGAGARSAAASPNGAPARPSSPTPAPSARGRSATAGAPEAPSAARPSPAKGSAYPAPKGGKGKAQRKHSGQAQRRKH